MKSCCDEQIFQAILTQMPTEHAPRQVVVDGDLMVKVAFFQKV